MRARFGFLALVACAATTGCITGFRHPLGSVSQSFIELPLLGSWTCTSTDEPHYLDLTFMNFDGRQYYLRSDDGKSEVYSHRVVATRLEGSSFLSVRAIGPKPDDEWTVLEYSFADPDHLIFRLVDPQPFVSLLDDPQAVRDHLSSHLQDPEVIVELLSCTRAQKRTKDRPEPAE